MIKNKTITHIIDLFFITRPVLLIPVWGFSAFGIFSVENTLAIQVNVFSAFLCLLFSLSVASVYIINQVCDIDADKENGGFPLLVRGNIPVSRATIVALCCAVVSVSIPVILQKYQLALLSLLALLLGILYSCKPTRFSGKPFLDFFSNAVGYGVIAFGAGWYIAGESIFSFQFINHALPYFLLMCSGSISSTLPDIEGDRKDEKITTAVYLGKRNAHILALLLLIIAAFASALQSQYIPFFCATLSLPIYVLFLLHPSEVFMEATYKIGGSLCIVASALAVPALFGGATLVFAATWLYFRRRYGIIYPSLIPVNNNEK
ncbi:UbiA family prenyltransferase [Chitinispirillales bacterium ANBcel5]|uniref:UbiA family prenyltransferase n=1 Tax=Cellulosispirillum alkaliphilum TaxID=3039283 RepID=UPI002A50A00D|nr:UbiA family prenyltransferase [Chitinispirillales bacterium ANBcel5]